ncbi:helix-turn-helix domain-containing protein [Paenibacillus filicis]|uniref:Helix-turn-helix domain-containing protein n=1 Tax=Paenibacillus gyeongsangnamensis TaxID=3388067 RepID=A0ABT4Q4E3_9BACL|nr:helix-turn-helix domain-containing protein [Paenibacillus filicis]MCZ8511728.1 helix-turn-helix domain-containing protein [Paenibacillus filicis]
MSNILHLLEPSETIEQLNECFFPPYITLAHLFNAPKGWGIKTRTLTQYQLQYVLEGKAEYQIEDKSITTKKGDLVYHSPNVHHSVNTVGDEPYICISIVFHFGSSQLPMEKLIGESRYIGNFIEHPIENKLSQLITYYHQPGPQNQIKCQGLLLQLIYDLLQWNQEQSQTKVQEKTKAKMVLIRNYIANNFNKNIQHKDLEEVSGLTRNYIIVKFRKAFGMTPFEYMTLVRIEKAKELAIQTNLSISEISRVIGYTDVHTFGRMFKNKTGASLSQFCSSLVTD